MFEHLVRFSYSWRRPWEIILMGSLSTLFQMTRDRQIDDFKSFYYCYNNNNNIKRFRLILSVLPTLANKKKFSKYFWQNCQHCWQNATTWNLIKSTYFWAKNQYHQAINFLFFSKYYKCTMQFFIGNID